ncbi:RNI-like protein [Epithele typhae]|uniref:RNI-like protein n=1 Tax=Epithele typhae TaxID=378194 RepID=UPI00200862E4|nr:RNI-like protein [Epithele typhae]KAH9944443.1 RNI-like protein [Epithele typhae]
MDRLRALRRTGPATPSERTPLLQGSPRRGQTTSSLSIDEHEDLPHIGPFVAAMRSEDLPNYTAENLYPPSLYSRSLRASFALCSLMYYRDYLKGHSPRGRNIWVQWTEEKRRTSALQDVDMLLSQVWAQFISEEGSPNELEEVLWAPFLLYPDSKLSVRLVDFLAAGETPVDLVTHPLIHLSLLDTWRYGRSSRSSDDSISARILHLVDGNGVPRGPLIALYALSRLCRRWSASTLSFALILGSFISFVPSTPPATSSAFLFAMLAFAWQIVLLHLPVHPSPLYLLPVERILPLTVLVWRGLLRTFLPVTAFFLPGFLISFFLLSVSLYDNFFVLSCGLFDQAMSSPMETRVLIFTLFIVMFIFLCCALGGAVLVQPFLTSPEGPAPLTWDRYSPYIGVEARRVFARTVAIYSGPYYFPAPLNILHILFVQFPAAVGAIAGCKSRSKVFDVAEKVLWRVTVAPFAFTMMSSRKRASRSGGNPLSKRRRTGGIGQPTPDDDVPIAQSQAEAPSASALSIRTVAPEHVSSLSTFCIRSFTQSFQRLSGEEDVWDDARLWLKELPDALLQRVFTALRQTCPTFLHHGFIATYLLRGHAIALGEDLPAVSRKTIQAIGDVPAKDKLRELSLTGLSKIADPVFAGVIKKLPSLRKINLRGCTKVSQNTADAIANHCTLLEVLNLNYTAVPAASLAPVLLNCKQLEVLKVAGIPNWTDTTVSKLWTALEVSGDLTFPNLRSLKLRQAPLTDTVLHPILAACPGLQRLNLSFTNVKSLTVSHGTNLPLSPHLEKLVLTSTKISVLELPALIRRLPKLRTLAIGALGGGQGSSAAIANTSAMTLTDDALRELARAIAAHCPDIERVSLVGNTKLGLTGSRGPDAALSQFVRAVGRRCKGLNLARITSLRSSDLEGLADADDGEGPPRLTHLNLNGTSVDDTAAPYLSACVDLQTLELGGTKMSSVGLFPIIDACEKLEKLDLTSCRGVKVGERRRFFEVWEEEWKNT